MAAGDITINQNWKLAQANGSAVDFDTDDIRVMVLTNAYSINQAHDFLDDVEANEVGTATGYTGPIALTTKSVALNGSTVEFDADDISIPQDAGGFTNGRWIVFFVHTGVSSTARLIAWGDLGSDRGNVDGKLDFNWNASGILNW